MDRRRFLVTLSLALRRRWWPGPSAASRRRRRGSRILASSTEANFAPSVKVFRETLHAAGWVEGRNLTLDVR